MHQNIFERVEYFCEKKIVVIYWNDSISGNMPETNNYDVEIQLGFQSIIYYSA